MLMPMLDRRATERPLRVIIADHDPLARRVVKDALQAAGIVVIAEAAGGRDAVELSLFYRPDVLLLDEALPELDGLAATRRLHATRPELKIVLLAPDPDPELVLEGLRAGAVGFLSKDIDLTSLPRALRGVARGEAAISRELTGELLDRLRHARADGSGLRPVRSALSDREWEVLDLLCAGRSTEQIAADLVLSPETVRSHVKHILRKLRVSTREAAIERARTLRADGLIPTG